MTDHTTDYTAETASRLRIIRQIRGMTHQQLAERTGIHQQSIARAEAGRHGHMLPTLRKLASAMDVDVAVLVSPHPACLATLGWDSTEDHDGPWCDGPAYLQPGWYVSTGDYEEYFCDLTAQEAAQEYLAAGDDEPWTAGEDCTSVRICVVCRRRGLAIDQDGEMIEVEGDDHEDHWVQLDPPEPPCSDGEGHDWGEGQVAASGGSTRSVSTCSRCGLRRIEDGWMTDVATGEHYDGVAYEHDAGARRMGVL